MSVEGGRSPGGDRRRRAGAAVTAVVAVLAFTGCSAVVSRSTARLADGLSAAVLDQPDPETVRQGAPAYLLMVDGLIANDPRSADLLRTGAELYAAYTSAFVDEPERARTLSARALEYGLAALCLAAEPACGIEEATYERFEEVVDGLGERAVPDLYAAAAAWATWIRARRDDWSAIADKARVDEMMQRVVELDEGYRNGGGHLYLGVLATLVPPALGGRPEAGRAHFERAIELSGGADLSAKVLLASEYARTVWDRELHDRLLEEVVESEPEAPGLTLTNILAQRQAARLLATADEYFGE